MPLCNTYISNINSIYRSNTTLLSIIYILFISITTMHSIYKYYL